MPVIFLNMTARNFSFPFDDGNNFTVQYMEDGHGNQRVPSYNSIVRAIRTIIIPSLCILGCLGNTVNLVVLTRLHYRKAEGHKESATHLGLIVLAVSDLMFCVALFPRGFVPDSSALFDHRDFWLYYHVLQSGFVTTFILISTWITVVMAVMRYIGICHPFSARRIDGPIFLKTSYLFVCCLCIVLNLPTFWFYKITEFHIGGHPRYLVDIGYIQKEILRAFTIFKIFVGIIIPSVTMAFCNFSLIVALRKSYQMRRQCHVQENASHPSTRITLILVVIIINFILLVFPCELMNISSDFFQLDATQTEISMVIRAFANMMEVVNFSFNFVIYCTINVKFRSVLGDMVKCRTRIDANNRRPVWQTSVGTAATNLEFASRNGEAIPLSSYENPAL